MAKLAPLGAVPLGDCAVYVEFAKTLDLDVNSAVQRLAAMVYGRALPWVRDVVPALGGLAIHFDPEIQRLGLRHVAEGAIDIALQVMEAQRGDVHGNRSRLDFGEVENVVDEAEQVVA